MSNKKLGRELIVGDVLDLWYNHNAVILKIESTGHWPDTRHFINKHFSNGCFVATTTANTNSGRCSITIESDVYYTLAN
jgi:hypothetical protein